MIRRAPLKNFKLRETLNEDEQAKLMHMLTRSCRDILHGTAIPSYSEVYYNCDLLCRYGHSRPLNSALYNEVTVWGVGQLAQQWRHVESTETLSKISVMWQEFEDKLRVLLDVFAVLDRVYVRREGAGSLGLQQIMLSTFKTAVWTTEKGRLWRVALAHLDQCRVGGIDVGDVRVVELRRFCGLLERLDVFGRDEESQETVSLLSERTAKYYNAFFNDASRTTASNNQQELPKMVHEKLQWEFAFQRAAFPESMESVLSTAVKKCLIGDRLGVLCGALLSCAVDNQNIAVCEQIYQLCAINENISQLATALMGIVKGTSMKLQVNADTAISEIIAFKDTIESQILASGFKDDPQIASAVKEGLEAAINQRTVLMSEQIAHHLHAVLTAAVTDVEGKRGEIAKGLSLFRFLQGKEGFELFYKQFLAERLLRKLSIGNDFEHYAIEVMREECGAAFTSRMEGMFRDTSNSRDTQTAFQKSAAYRSKATTALFNVNVITNGIWPPVSESVNKMFVPKDIQQDMLLFEQYYQKFAKKRKLKWEPMLADCVIRVPVDQGVVDVEMPAFVASVLFQFDCSDLVAVEECLVGSGLERIWFEKAVSLLKEFHIITATNDTLKFNSKAKFSTEKITIGLHTVRFTTPAPSPATDDIFAIRQQDKEERSFRIDAAIVRFLKRNRQEPCQLADLQAHVGNLDFLEERLKVLVEREFVEQRPDGSLLYLP